MTVELQIAPSLLQTLLDDQTVPLSAPLAAINQRDDGSPVVCASRITPALRATLDQMLTCDYTGALQRLYLEGNAVESIALYLGTLQSSPASVPALRPNDADRIHQARDRLIDQMEQPPSLLDLARSVNISDRKLKAGFRQVFGTTVFGYLHGQRMERARQLLTQRDRSVSEVAWAIGYHNPSKFAAAYKKHFDMTPKQTVVEPKLSGWE